MGRLLPGARGSGRASGCGQVALLSAVLVGAALGHADDDETEPPFDPGVGFEGILPNPPIPPYLKVDQRTTPFGVRQVFNTPQTVMGQAFRPTQASLDWAAFVFQNHTQPNTVPGPGVLRVRLFTTLDHRSGTLSGLLGETEELSIPSNTTAWLIFSFPRPIPVTPGVTHYFHLEFVRGYPSWVGGRLQDFYPGGGAFGYLPNPFGGPPQDLAWGRYDLVFAHGTGRGLTGVSPGEYLQWGLPYGLKDSDELGDSDKDRHCNFVEFLRDANPVDPNPSRTSRPHLVEVDGLRYLALTVATPARLDYGPQPGGAIRGTTGMATDVFTAAVEVGGTNPPGLGLVEVIPAALEGMPPLSETHRYRTFRLSEPITSVPRGFIVNHARLEDD